MILGAEIALLLMGLYALVTGKLTLGNQRVVYGAPARVLGVVGLLPVPLTICGSVVLSVLLACEGRDPLDPALDWMFIVVEAASVVFCLVVVYSVGAAVAGPPPSRDRFEYAGSDPYQLYMPDRVGGPPLPAGSYQG